VATRAAAGIGVIINGVKIDTTASAFKMHSLDWGVEYEV
jgi:hypothetical protein